MTDFLRLLPRPSSLCVDPALGAFRLLDSNDSQFNQRKKESTVPPYGKRSGWIPKSLSDFVDGGAYPEVSVAQYPLDMRSQINTNSGTVALQIGADGELEYEAVIKHDNNKSIVYSKPGDQIPAWSSAEDRSNLSQDEQESIEKARFSIQQALNRKVIKGQSKIEKSAPEFYKYTPNQQAPGHNANCQQRVIRLVDVAEDPLDVAKFRHKRIPRGPPSPPPPIQHSPPRKLTQKDQQDWKVPPCVSNWKNQKGYTIPLDKRLQADGRGLHDVTINDKFAAFSEALYIAERSAREDIRLRNEMMKKKKAMEEKLREQQLRQLAAKARAERSNMLQTSKQETETAEEIVTRQEREHIEKERKREIERDLRLEKAGKKHKGTRDEDRDISERIALGQAQPTSQESLYDARLFNQSAGFNSGYGIDDGYSIYDKPLFADRGSAGIYRFESERLKQNAGELSNLTSFTGAEKTSQQRTGPVEFEKYAADPFGLDNLLFEARKK